MDTVPNKVDHLFKAQLFHDRKQRAERLSESVSTRSTMPYTDFLRPIIAGNRYLNCFSFAVYL